MAQNNGATPPADAVILFDGASLGPWMKRDGTAAAWPVENGDLITQGGDILSRETFRDFYLHVEFLCPNLGPEVTGQGRSNSGVFLQGRYEIQVLDSYGIEDPGRGDCGALYNHAAPLVNACNPPDAWQTYDVFFRAPRFDDAGNKVENARATLLQNGRVVQNNQEIPKQTGGALDENYAEAGPILLQDHGNRVRFRNVWLVPLRPSGADHY